MKYYETPSQEVFDEVQEKSIEVWKENHSDEHGYVTEKVESIRDLTNIRNNVMYIVGKFDTFNQMRLSNKLSETTRKEIRDRFISGGSYPEHIVF
jgi:hypothetical protein